MTDPPPGTLETAKAFASMYVLPAGVRVLVAVLVFIAGRWIARGIITGADRLMERSHLDVSLRKFIGSLLYALMFVAVVVVALDTIGVRTTAIVAVIGAAGITIGLALQGSLSNFAAGVMLILFRPYKVGDLVVIGKYLGRVDAIKVFSSVLVTADSREITLPNGQIIANPIENLTALGRRRIDLLVTVPTDRELAPLKELLAGAAAADARAKTEPAVAVEVAEITDAGTRLRVRTWTATESYAPLAAASMEAMRDALRAQDLKFSIVLETPVA